MKLDDDKPPEFLPYDPKVGDIMVVRGQVCVVEFVDKRGDETSVTTRALTRKEREALKD